jgi:hypothetical protein
VLVIILAKLAMKKINVKLVPLDLLEMTSLYFQRAVLAEMDFMITE